MEIILPTTNELENELKRVKYRKLFSSTIYILLIVIAVSVLIATYLFPSITNLW